MHIEILDNNQVKLLPLLNTFKREFYMVGGTAIALYIGHRRSVDFDLFKPTPIHANKILQKVRGFSQQITVTRNVHEQVNLIVNDVKMTFYEFPYQVKASFSFNGYIKLPHLLTLAAMKSFVLGRRSKWKDYVDLYFIIRDYYSIEEIAIEAQNIFGDLFSEKLFRAQLCYFEDVDYTEEIDFMPGYETCSNKIKSFLTENSLSIDL